MLFPDLKGHDMVIPTVPLDDNIVSKAREGALNLLRCNFPGPKKCVILDVLRMWWCSLYKYSELMHKRLIPLSYCRYLSLYSKYNPLLDGSASAHVDLFLAEGNDLDVCGKVCHLYL